MIKINIKVIIKYNLTCSGLYKYDSINILVMNAVYVTIFMKALLYIISCFIMSIDFLFVVSLYLNIVSCSLKVFDSFFMEPDNFLNKSIESSVDRYILNETRMELIYSMKIVTWLFIKFNLLATDELDVRFLQSVISRVGIDDNPLDDTDDTDVAGVLPAETGLASDDDNEVDVAGVLPASADVCGNEVSNGSIKS